MNPLGIQSDPQLADWNTYFQMLLSDQLSKYQGRFIVIHNGKIVPDGEDPRDLRLRMSKEMNVPSERLVIPFVE
jgi:hypothetical protein